MSPLLPVTRAECVLYRVSPCTLLEGVVVVLNDTWHNSSNKQQNQQQTERRAANMGTENLHRHMSNDSYNYAAYNASAPCSCCYCCLYSLVHCLYALVR